MWRNQRPAPNTSHALQAYGAGNYMALGLVLQQALIISTLVFLVILALWTQAGPILLLAGTLILQTESPSNCVAQCPRHALQYHPLHDSPVQTNLHHVIFPKSACAGTCKIVSSCLTL